MLSFFIFSCCLYYCCCHLCVWVPIEVKRRYQIPCSWRHRRLWATWSGCWELNSCFPQELWVLLTTGLSLQPITPSLLSSFLALPWPLALWLYSSAGVCTVTVFKYKCLHSCTKCPQLHGIWNHLKDTRTCEGLYRRGYLGYLNCGQQQSIDWACTEWKGESEVATSCHLCFLTVEVMWRVVLAFSSFLPWTCTIEL